jgi:uncharacterized membrane protein
VYNVALFFHLLGALMFFAGIVLAGAGFETARRRTRAHEIALLLSLARIGVALVAVGGLMLPVFGLWLVHLGDWGYGTGWIVWGLALYVAAMVLGSLGGQQPKRARRLAARLAEREEPVSAQLRALLDDPLARAENYASLLIVIAIVAVMVFKP